MLDQIKLPRTADLIEQSGTKLTDGEKLLYDLEDMNQELKDLNEELNPRQDIEDALVAARFMPTDEEVENSWRRERK
jgi:flagellar hook-length control protein FliK